MTVLSLYHTSNPTGVACYPQLHTLNIRHLDVPTTRHYVTTFPNLQVLDATECIGSFSEDEECTRRRNLNISQQVQGGSWCSLRGYVGSILFLYLFGITCHVTYVRVNAHDEYESMDFDKVRAVVADTHPEHLVVEASEVSHILDQTSDIIALFKDAEFQAVKTFVLDLSLSTEDHKTDMEAMLECVFTAVSSSSSLVGFALVIEWSSLGCGIVDTIRIRPSGKKQRPTKRPRAQVFLKSLDVHSVADRLLQSCQSLQAVKVTLGDVTVDRGPVDLFFDEETLGPG
ncbi:hypothetical protein LXA43DRAFT_1104650 [Ganoderma leucocontextum]|nr:hypothetical protein LXA43DRAFT_1104650 [Ganoderma leucocontextum]